MLETKDMTVSYSKIVAARDVCLSVQSGEIVALVGANGAGKSSCLKGIMGLARTHGTVMLKGTDISQLGTDKRVADGLALVPEGRHVFPDMTVLENLQLGDRASIRDDGVLESIFERFPIIRDRIQQQAGTLSGGEQQMLVIGRALMSRPAFLLLDEPTLGLAPMIVDRVASTLLQLREEGMGLLAEQNLHMALAVADRGYVLETGDVTLTGTAADLKSDVRVRDAYLGV